MWRTHNSYEDEMSLVKKKRRIAFLGTFFLIVLFWYFREILITSLNSPDWMDIILIIVMIAPVVIIVVYVFWTLVDFQWDRAIATLLFIGAFFSSMPLAKFAFLNWLLIIISAAFICKTVFYPNEDLKKTTSFAVIIALLFSANLLSPTLSARWSYAAYVDPVTAFSADVYLTQNQKKNLKKDGYSRIETKNPQIRMDSENHTEFIVEKYGIVYIASF